MDEEGGSILPEDYHQLAGEVGLDQEGFREALRTRKYREAHQQALHHAYEEAGISGVPAFFIGPHRLEGLQSRETLERATEKAMRLEARP